MQLPHCEVCSELDEYKGEEQQLVKQRKRMTVLRNYHTCRSSRFSLYKTIDPFICVSTFAGIQHLKFPQGHFLLIHIQDEVQITCTYSHSNISTSQPCHCRESYLECHPHLLKVTGYINGCDQRSRWNNSQWLRMRVLGYSHKPRSIS